MFKSVRPIIQIVTFIVIFNMIQDSCIGFRSKPYRLQRARSRLRERARTIGSSEVTWCYGDSPDCGENTWEEECNEGNLQSPIDIPTKDQMKVQGRIENFTRTDYDLQGFTIDKEGNLFMVFPPNESEPLFCLQRDMMILPCYKLNGVAFVWGHNSTEGTGHAFDGKRFAMEIQFLFYRGDLESFEKAMTTESSDAILAISILLKEDPSANNSSQFLDTIIRNLHGVQDSSNSKIESLEELKLSELLSFETPVYSYYGSLPIPPCTQNVAWMVRSDLVKIRPGYVEPFRGLKNSLSNPWELNSRSPVKMRDHQLHAIEMHSGN